MEHTKQSKQKKIHNNPLFTVTPCIIITKNFLFFTLLLFYTRIGELLKTFTFKIIIISILLCRIQTEAEKIRIFISFYFPYYSKSGRYFPHYYYCCHIFIRILLCVCLKTNENDGIMPKTPELSFIMLYYFRF